jgi:Zn finger protein HypA/HybF involved in hydrogenase expression
MTTIKIDVNRKIKCNKCGKELHDTKMVVNYCEDCLAEIKTLQPKL